MYKLLTILLMSAICSTANAWNWMQPQVTCVNGQCTLVPARAESLSRSQGGLVDSHADNKLGTGGVSCVNGTCQPLRLPASKAVSPVYKTGIAGESLDCPDGRCPLVKREISPSNGSAVFRSIGSQSSGVNKLQALPTLAPSDCTCVNCQCGNITPRPQPAVITRPLASVMVRSGQRVRGSQWRPFQRLFGRR